ncbi:hypothetical protein D7X55_25105 [Corallococcus sp. AB049A]|uniref:Uncharacterized protein n=1 Tax=Corallococcus interemptor TaxID=2316720 RepID=A0A3A8R030_9BACT|nr:MULTISPECIES: hypothetical protein [Corallococcus]RKH45853.1 hypothetical protein D7Y23_24920 [Corallococcus sp. AB050B]RKH70462.1 hypothetical protein D7X96_11425 [Corallococcus interemptor]RKI59909.1 hypothetical protein D7X55_25105 [Corallococcus sp. AB049A]
MLIRLIPRLLLAWFTVSFVCQFLPMRLQGLFRALDVFGLIPRWMFFSPSFSASDYHLLYREALCDGTLTQWREIPLAERRSLLGAVWNPERRHRKAVATAVARLVQQAESRRGPLTQAHGYAAILALITSRGGTPLTRAFQFAIAESFGYEARTPSRMVLVSELHAR